MIENRLAKAAFFATLRGPLPGCAVSSVVEHYLDTVGVTGSNPVSRTIFSYPFFRRFFDSSAIPEDFCRKPENTRRFELY